MTVQLKSAPLLAMSAMEQRQVVISTRDMRKDAVWEELWRMRAEGVFTDVALACAGGVRVAAHRAVLEAHSKMLRGIFGAARCCCGGGQVKVLDLLLFTIQVVLLLLP